LNYLQFEYTTPLFKAVFMNLINTPWGEIYHYIRAHGINKASLYFKRSVQDLYFIPAIKYAQDYYVAYNKGYPSFMASLRY
jgi:hypothetical protein